MEALIKVMRKSINVVKYKQIKSAGINWDTKIWWKRGDTHSKGVCIYNIPAKHGVCVS